MSHFYFLPNIRDIQCFSVTEEAEPPTQTEKLPPPQTYLHQIKSRWRFHPTKQPWRKHHRPETSLDGLDVENLFDALMLVGTSKTRSGGKTSVFRVKLTLSEPGNNHSAGFGRIHPPGDGIHLSPEMPPPPTPREPRSKVTTVFLHVQQARSRRYRRPSEEQSANATAKGE